MAKKALDGLRRACGSELAAAEFLEAERWGSSPACPVCGVLDVYKMADAKTGERNKDLRWRCRGCKKMFTVRTGTVMAETRLPLRAWTFAMWSACASKKGVSALQISRECEISYKSALFLLKRIRFAMAIDHSKPPKLKGTVEADETYVGGKPRYRASKGSGRTPRYGVADKPPVFAVVERGGEVRARTVKSVTRRAMTLHLRQLVDRSARLITDEAPVYWAVGPEFRGGHETVNHSSREYARGDVTTNSIEGFFALLKRGVIGTFHSVSREHLHRYVAEFEFRYNARKISDAERVSRLIQQTEGKRLTYDQATISTSR